MEARNLTEKEIELQLKKLYKDLDEHNIMINDIIQNEGVCSYDYDLYDNLCNKRGEIERKIQDLEFQLDNGDF